MKLKLKAWIQPKRICISLNNIINKEPKNWLVCWNHRKGECLSQSFSSENLDIIEIEEAFFPLVFTLRYCSANTYKSRVIKIV